MNGQDIPHRRMVAIEARPPVMPAPAGPWLQGWLQGACSCGAPRRAARGSRRAASPGPCACGTSNTSRPRHVSDSGNSRRKLGKPLRPPPPALAEVFIFVTLTRGRVVERGDAGPVLKREPGAVEVDRRRDARVPHLPLHVDGRLARVKELRAKRVPEVVRSEAAPQPGVPGEPS